jgi:hypothetical protein
MWNDYGFWRPGRSPDYTTNPVIPIPPAPPAPPVGFIFLLGADGAFLQGADGAFLLGAS